MGEGEGEGDAVCEVLVEQMEEGPAEQEETITYRGNPGPRTLSTTFGHPCAHTLRQQ